MFKENQNFNENIKSNSAFLAELKEKLPQFFTKDEYDENNNLITESKFDLAKFENYLKKNNIDNE
ncbi:MAG: hypothetical protein LBM96_02885 [Methanobrevibacter sp.]|jgi:adenine-specific DNA-methyltransferase|nr:hypothetical protein [Candidatus Methanoflexus mossambicus]